MPHPRNLCPNLNRAGGSGLLLIRSKKVQVLVLFPGKSLIPGKAQDRRYLAPTQDFGPLSRKSCWPIDAIVSAGNLDETCDSFPSSQVL